MLYLVILLNLCIVALVIGFLRLRRSQVLPYDPVWAILLGFSLNYCLRPPLMELSYADFSAYPDYLGEGALSAYAIPALTLAFAFIVAFGLGQIVFSTVRSNWLPTVTISQIARQKRFRTVALVLSAMAPLGLYGYLATTGWSGSLQELLTGKARFHILGKHIGLGYYNFGLYLGNLGCAMAWLKWVLVDPERTREKRADFIAAVCTTVVVLAAYIIFGERSNIIAIVFIVVVFTVFLRHPKRTPEKRRPRVMFKVALWGGLVILAAGPLGVVFKGAEWRPAKAVSLAISPWDAYEFTELAAGNPEVDGRLLGRSYVEDMFYTYLPRAFFPDKPLRYGMYSIQDMILPQLQVMTGSFPVGMVVEAYVNGGIAGCIVIGLFLAALTHGVRQQLARGDLFWIIQAALMSPTLAVFRSLGFALAQLCLDCAVLGLVFLLLRGPTPHASTASLGRRNRTYRGNVASGAWRQI